MIASYDFDAPINEAGDATEKFVALRDVIAKYVPVSPGPVPPPSPRGAYGVIEMKEYAPLFQALDLFKRVNLSAPREMESFDYGYGYILYTTVLQNFTEHLADLKITAVQDRALVYVDGVYEGELGWAVDGAPTSIPIKPVDNGNPTARLDILVENKGRPSGEVQNFDGARKGISGQVELNGKVLTGQWTHTLLPMTNLSSTNLRWIPYGVDAGHVPAFYRGTLTVDDAIPLHTFLLVDGWNVTDTWGHGFVMING